MLEALAHAHSKGVVHRDVKPANVMLEDGDEVSVRLLDFGLAQLGHADTLTAVGDVPGTLAYIAPERLAGEDATGAADVWAVGVLLWGPRRPPPVLGRIAARNRTTGRAGRTTARRAAPGPAARALPRRGTHALGRPPQASRCETGAQPPANGRAEPDGAPPSYDLAHRPAGAPHAALAALFAGGTAFLLPFFPTGWPFLLGAVVGLVAP